MEPPWTPSAGTIVGCTQSVSVPICALSGEYVLIHGTQQSSLPSAIRDSSIVASPVVETPQTPSAGTIVDCRVHTVSVSVSTHSCSLRQVCANPWHPTIIPPVGDHDSSILASPVVEPPWTPSAGTIVGCTQSVSVPICALSGEYVLIHGTQQSSLLLAIRDNSILASPVVEPPRTPSAGTIVGCTQSVSVPILALSGEYDLCSLRQVCPDQRHPPIVLLISVLQMYHV